MTKTAFKVLDSFEELFDIRPKLQDKLSDLKIDSLDRQQLILLLEQQFEICFPDEKIDNIQTVQDVVNLVEQLEQFSNPVV